MTLSSAIRLRPPSPRVPVWIFVSSRGSWCLLRSASAGELLTTLCLDSLHPEPVHVSTVKPANTCPACEVELAAGTPGAAVAGDAVPDAVEDAITEPRAITADLRPARRRTDPVVAWDGEFCQLEDQT